MEQTKYDVFISYSRKDYVNDNGNIIPNNIITKIKDALTQNNISYWFDEDGIYSGDEFASILTQAIRNSKIFLFMSSVNSNQSPWTSNEISTALEYRKTIIPFRLDNSPYNDSVMMKIVSLDRIDCNNHNIAITKLLKAIRHHIYKRKIVKRNIIENTEKARRVTEFLDVDGEKKERVLSLDVNEKIPDFHFKNNLEEKDVCCSSTNPNDIFVFNSDYDTPTVILMGPPQVGKTMTMVRLVRYMVEQGYVVTPDRSFRSTSDNVYRNLCDGFQELVHGGYASKETSLQECMLVNVQKKGINIMQIVDLSGNIIMNLGANNTPAYFYRIISSKNPKIWVFIIEPNWGDGRLRSILAKNIMRIKNEYIPQSDNIVVVYNKIDKNPMLVSQSNNIGGIITQIKQQYPELYDVFHNKKTISRLWHPFDCSFVPFMTGTFVNDSKGRCLYIPSPMKYPSQLWKKLLFLIDLNNN